VREDAKGVLDDGNSPEESFDPKDEGMMRYYNALVLAYNDKIGGSLSLEDFLFDDEAAGYVIAEL